MKKLNKIKLLCGTIVLILSVAGLVACGNNASDTTSNVESEPSITEHIHDFIDEMIPATCTEEGRVISKCECGEVESDEILPPWVILHRWKIAKMTPCVRCAVSL